VNGSVSGNVDFDLTEIDNVTHKLVAKFDNYNDGISETMTGTVIYTIVYEDSQSGIIKQMNMDIDLLTIRNSENSTLLDGLVVAYVDNSTGNIRYVYNTVSKDNNTNEMNRLENFEVLLDAEDRPLSYKGKLYYSQDGYVTVSTPTQLSYSNTSVIPDVGGEIHFEGDDAIVKERIAYDGRIRVEIDKGKDGISDEFEVYNSSTMEIVPNTAPVVNITFPKEIFTDTNMSSMKITTYDPDLDNFTNTYVWKVNGVVKATSLELSSSFFKKNDLLKLIVTSKDREQISVTEKEQKVLNSRPVVTLSFPMMSLVFNDSIELNYTISDLDNDSLEVTWEHTGTYSEDILQGYLSFTEGYNYCDSEIELYEYENNISYSDLTIYQQEDLQHFLCEDEFSYLLDDNFVQNKTFTALSAGFFKHKMIVSDGESRTTRRLASHVSYMDVIDSEEYNHEAYVHNETQNVYMEDMNNDGKKDLIHIIGLDVFSEKAPLFVIEYRDGKTLLDRVELEVPKLTPFELDDFFIKDLNGDGKLDILFSYSGYLNQYGRMLQKEDGTFENLEKFTLSNRESISVDNVIGDDSDEIIIVSTSEFYERNNKVIVYSNEVNKTIDVSLPTAFSYFSYETEVIVHDVDKNLKQDIIVISKKSNEENELNFDCNILSQELDGSFSDKFYTVRLQNTISAYTSETIQSVQIVDIDQEKDIWLVHSSKRIYLMKLEDAQFRVLKTIEYAPDTGGEIRVLGIVDINKDSKDDIIFGLNAMYQDPIHIMIQKDNLEFLPAQKYNFTNLEESFDAERTLAFGDIDNNGKYEVFLSTGEENLSVLYFK